jgi:hypothetical protein
VVVSTLVDELGGRVLVAADFTFESLEHPAISVVAATTTTSNRNRPATPSAAGRIPVLMRRALPHRSGTCDAVRCHTQCVVAPSESVTSNSQNVRVD